MLGGNAEFLLIGTTLTVFLNHTLVLSIYLTGIHQKFCPVIGQCHTTAATVEYNDSKLLLQLLHCIGQRRLGNIQRLRSFI